MLAVSRTHSVIGRMILLVSSIRTIKFIRARGVPWGSKWESMCFVFFGSAIGHHCGSQDYRRWEGEG